MYYKYLVDHWTLTLFLTTDTLTIFPIFEKAAHKGDVYIHFISRLVVNNEPPAGMSSLGSAMGNSITI